MILFGALGKRDTTETSATESSATAASEDTAEPVHRVDTPSDEKGSDLAELLAERDAQLEERDKAIKELQEKVLRSYAEVENILARSQREAESTRKFALQVCELSLSMSSCFFYHIVFFLAGSISVCNIFHLSC